MTNDMSDIRKSEFYSIIFNHVSRSRSNLMNKVWIMSRKIGRDDMGMVHMIFDKTSDLLAVTDVRSRICVWMGSRRRSGSFPAEVLALPLVALRRAV